MKRLEHKVAIVTGASRGIGRAIAKAFLDEGASVVVTSRRQEAADAAVASFQHSNAVAMACDISNYTAVERVVLETIERFGRLDVLVNNAGIAEAYQRIIDAPLEAWYEPIDVNLKGTYHGCRAVLPHFLKQGKGKIINMAGAGSGDSASDNTACISGYAASKAAIKRLTFSLSQEYKNSGVEIMLLNPGLVRTEILGLHKPTDELRQRANAFEIIRDIFAQPPSVAAELAVKMASEWSNGKSGVYLSALSKWRAQQLLWSYPIRRWLGTIDKTEY